MARRQLGWLFAGLAPLSRKQGVSFLLLGVMGGVLVLGPPPYDTVLAGLVSLLLGTDYELLEWLGLGAVYDWLENARHILDTIELNYRVKTFLEEGPDRIDLQHVDGGDMRGRVSTDFQLVEGLPFWVAVDAPLGDDDGLSYPLLLGRARLSRLTELDSSADGQALFFTVVEWERTFQDTDEERAASEYRSAIRSGEDWVEPFAFVVETDEVHELGLGEWKQLYENLKSVYDDLET